MNRTQQRVNRPLYFFNYNVSQLANMYYKREVL